MSTDSHRPALIIDPVVSAVELQGAQEVIRSWEGHALHLRPALMETPEIPGRYEDYSAVVVLGSSASVNNPMPWLQRVESWLQPILDGDVDLPVLGICFGHQLIAKLMGGRIGYLREDQSKRKGVEESIFQGCRWLPNGTRLRAVVSHREVVVERPDALLPIATRPGVPFDGLQHPERSIYSVQFHPEAREGFAERVGIDVNLVDDGVYSDGRLLLKHFRDHVLAR